MVSVNAAVASARREIARTLLTDTCNVITPTKGASDGRFGWTAGTPVTAHSNIRCLIQRRQVQDAEGAVQQRLQGRSYVTIHLETDKTIAMEQTIQRDSETYEVIGKPVLATNGLTLEVPCARNS